MYPELLGPKKSSIHPFTVLVAPAAKENLVQLSSSAFFGPAHGDALNSLTSGQSGLSHKNPSKPRTKSIISYTELKILVAPPKALFS